MKTLEERLIAIVALLPEKQQAQLTAPLTAGESMDTRLVEAARALGKSEGLVCMTSGEFSRAVVEQAAQRTMPAIAPAADARSPKTLAERFAAITDPRAQTDFWRSLTALQRADLLKAQQ